MNIYQTIFKKNEDLISRVKDNGLKPVYLRSEDVLILELEDADASDSIEVANGLVVIHYNPDTYRIVGFTIPYATEFQTAFKHLEEKQTAPSKSKRFSLNIPSIK